MKKLNCIRGNAHFKSPCGCYFNNSFFEQLLLNKSKERNIYACFYTVGSITLMIDYHNIFYLLVRYDLLETSMLPAQI